MMWQEWSSKAHLLAGHGMELTRSLPYSAPKDDGDLFKLTLAGLFSCTHPSLPASLLLSVYNDHFKKQCKRRSLTTLPGMWL